MPAHPRALILFLLALSVVSTRAIAGDGDRDAEKFFEQNVRPVLVANCVKCHGPDQQKGHLRLDLRESAFAGGDSGPPIEPGDPAASLLIEAVRHDGLKMPPKGKLTSEQITAMERWVASGASWPKDQGKGHTVAGAVAARESRGDFTSEERSWWAIQPLRRPAVPNGGLAESSNPIDAFVNAKLVGAKLQPAPRADRYVLVRRLSFDLTGLPPTPQEVEAFVQDDRPDAYERLVDRLLASPAYGARWGRHWLDLVRYAESDGYKQDTYRPEAWRYRDYVVDALNADVPYDRFVTEQLAGDEIDPNDLRLRVATSFLRLWPYEYNQRDVEGQWSAILNDLTDVTGDVFLGIGLSCARCHDHKFDPILQSDYYRIQAFFTPILPRDDLPLAGDAEILDQALDQAVYDMITADVRDRIARIEAPHKKAGQAAAIAMFQPHLEAILRKPAGQRDPRERQLAYFMERQLSEEFGNVSARIKGDEKKVYDRLLKELATFDAVKPKPIARALSATDVDGEPPATLLPRGKRGIEVAPGFLTILEAKSIEEEGAASGGAGHDGSSGRRLALARWITSDANPLPARVLANRVWQYHFGRGLSATASDFGKLGEVPSHPALLDWLASELVESGWSLKHLHRLIVTSGAYQRGAQRDAALASAARLVDPENRLLWERRPARLEAEPLRDAMLAASGELKAKDGGSAVEAKEPYRAILTRQARNQVDPFMAAFDAPDGSASLPQRGVTTTATQALDLINGEWTLARANALARRLGRQHPGDSAGQIEEAYNLLFGRAPSEGEQTVARRFLYDQTARAFQGKVSEAQARDRALVDFCHTLLNSSAFLYVE